MRLSPSSKGEKAGTFLGTASHGISACSPESAFWGCILAPLYHGNCREETPITGLQWAI